MSLVLFAKKEVRPVFLTWVSKIKKILSDICCMYPHFEEWLDKVLEEAPSRERCILLDVEGNEIRGIAILKNTGDERKICTLRVNDKFKRQGIGEALLKESYRILGTTRPLMTVNEDNISEYRRFLTRNGARLVSEVTSLYYCGKKEYFFNVPYEEKAVVLSVKPQYASRIVSGEKKVEFRKKIFKSSVKQVFVYSSYPEKKIIGFFDIEKVDSGTPSELWRKYCEVSGVCAEDFLSYFDEVTQAYAICIRAFHKYDIPISPASICEGFKAPQSFCYLNNIEMINKLKNRSSY